MQCFYLNDILHRSRNAGYSPEECQALCPKLCGFRGAVHHTDYTVCDCLYDDNSLPTDSASLGQYYVDGWYVADNKTGNGVIGKTDGATYRVCYPYHYSQ